MLEIDSIASKAVRGDRTVWVQRSTLRDPRTIFLFLDEELYLERVKANAMIDGLQEELRFPSASAVYLSYGKVADRHVDFTCSRRFSEFLIEELVPWVERNVHPFEHIVLCGLSLSGLAALYASLEYPNAFSGVLSQSPSAWWNHEWLSMNLPPSGDVSPRIWLSVGNQEIQEHVTHAPSNLYQRVSQNFSCRRVAQGLQAAGHSVYFSEFDGGHDPVCWAGELAESLFWLLQPTETVVRSERP